MAGPIEGTRLQPDPQALLRGDARRDREAVGVAGHDQHRIAAEVFTDRPEVSACALFGEEGVALEAFLVEDTGVVTDPAHRLSHRLLPTPGTTTAPHAHAKL